MGVYSSITISRNECISRINDLIHSESVTNDELSSALFGLTCEHTLDNYHVVDLLDVDAYKFFGKPYTKLTKDELVSLINK